MDDIIKDEVYRINPETVMTQFEQDVQKEIFEWVSLQDRDFETSEQAIEAYWEEKLNDSNSGNHSSPRLPGVFRWS